MRWYEISGGLKPDVYFAVFRPGDPEGTPAVPLLQTAVGSSFSPLDSPGASAAADGGPGAPAVGSVWNNKSLPVQSKSNRRSFGSPPPN